MTPPLILAPFVLLLLAIALGPLCFPAFWSRHYPKVCGALALLVVAVYLLVLHNPARVWETASQYLTFIVVVGSLFVVSGGIHITVKGGATPVANVLFLLAGAVAANLLGAIGASMLLIRPWLRLNRPHFAPRHVAFFIFLVSNVGGCLTPLGPPLLLGYTLGVPFWWTTTRCLPAWAVAVALLLIIFYILDKRACQPAAAQHVSERWRFEGLFNLFFLAVILAAMAVNHPHFLREAIMLAAALASWFTTGKAIHRENHFHFEPLKEVAILFFAIFATMMPALDWLQAHAASLPAAGPATYYFGAGTLSSVLDNAPTYLCFLQAALSANHATLPQLISDPQLAAYLVAISVGSVFFGASTYIGNAPNFMVKAIADHQKLPTPGFLEYMWRFTLPFLAPTLLLVGLLFFR